MNTGSWGPKTWIYTHTVAQNYKPDLQMKWVYKKFFTILQDILPCKYCRASYKEFIVQLPMEPHMNTKREFVQWFYTIHNKVNDKLRKQGYIHTRDPSLKCIYKKYSRILQSVMDLSDTKSSDCMWYFLHTVSFNFDPKLHSPQKYVEFFNLVGEAMPYPLIKPVYQKLLKDYPLQDFINVLPRWLYNIHKQINIAIGQPKLHSFSSIERKFNAIRSDCNKSDGDVGINKDKVSKEENIILVADIPLDSMITKTNTLNDLIRDLDIPKSNTGNRTHKISNTCQIPDSSKRCKAQTLRGRQCIKCNNNGESYCIQHQKLFRRHLF